jgi:hypothetical protein
MYLKIAWRRNGEEIGHYSYVTISAYLKAKFQFLTSRKFREGCNLDTLKISKIIFKTS